MLDCRSGEAAVEECAMGLPRSNSAASSPSFSINFQQCPQQEVADARYNPLFIQSGTHGADSQCNQGSNTYGYLGNRSLHTNRLINNSAAIEQSKIALTNVGTHNSPLSPMRPPSSTTAPRKLQVIYYLTRSGQLEQPHLLEVSIPLNDALHLKDVKRQLGAVRGKRLPSKFAWSYKRSYKNGYVWQDLSDDDPIFPAHGCEYVLKGSEILYDEREAADTEELSQASGHDALSSGTRKEELDLTSVKRAHRNLHEATISLVDTGTDAATQTEDDAGPSDIDVDDMNKKALVSSGLHMKHQDMRLAKRTDNSSISRPAAGRAQNAEELHNGESASPPSSSSATNSPSPYKDVMSASSSSVSGFSVAAECGSSRNHAHDLSVSGLKSGSKTPGRSWMKTAIHKLEERNDKFYQHNSSRQGVDEEFYKDLSSVDRNADTDFDRRLTNNSTASMAVEDAQSSPEAVGKHGRGKHFSVVSFLQFLSCGGLDIKEQMLPMSLYRLRSRGTPAVANQLRMSNYVLSPEHPLPDSHEACGSSDVRNLWSRISKTKSLRLSGVATKPPRRVVSEVANGESDARQVHRHYSQPLQEISVAGAIHGGSTKSLGASMQDVISLGRSSISDRSTTASHELQYADARTKMQRSLEEVANNKTLVGSTAFIGRSEGFSVMSSNGEETERRATAVTREIQTSKSSPLLGTCQRHLNSACSPRNKSGSSNVKPLAQLIKDTILEAQHEAAHTADRPKELAEGKAAGAPIASCNPSRAFSESDVSCMFTNRSGLRKSEEQRSTTLNGYDRTMAQLWEELLAAPTAVKAEQNRQKDGDFTSTWEMERRALQYAVELSLQPPLDNHLLHIICPQCGRRVKAHGKSCLCCCMKSTSSDSGVSSVKCLNANLNINNFVKSPKSDSNPCQRCLRASPQKP
ncbi:hypothetical protein KP509_13G026100 [Ceratopteris richardii]|uniref:SOSEKI DIX-like domain-containing protein n=1 Tax=Ceratopteris richardii TaxID=49495 RepID=A0A8T2TGF8_CERRI|nr:hypothetical protein KP509_13G026100 [Ceratopteris richardii]